MKWIPGLIITVLLTTASRAQAWPGLIRPFDFLDFSVAQQIEDFHVLTAAIEEYYAPLEYKQQRFGFKWETLKADYEKKISAGDFTREQFVSLMQHFVSRLADAHTRALNTRALYIDSGVRLASLGFKTRRLLTQTQEVAEVTEILPGFYAASNDAHLTEAPIKKGDLISRIDGQSIGDYVRTELLPYSNTGDEPASLSLAYRFVFNRTNVLFPLSPNGVVNLEIIRGSDRIERSIPWVHLAASELKKASDNSEEEARVIAELREDGKVLLQSRSEFDDSPFEQVAAPEYTMQNFFSPLAALAADASEETKSYEDAPKDAQEITIDGLKLRLFQTTKGLAAIYRVHDFTTSRMHNCSTAYKNGKFQIQVCEPFTAKHYASVFTKLKKMGVKALILDTRSNPGGVLKMGYELIKGLSSKSLETNDSRIRITEEWMAGFQSLAQSNKIPKIEREGYQKTYEILKQDIAAKRRLSSPIQLMGSRYMFGAPNAWDGPLYVLIDELCASMCDIFAAVVQDHGLGKIIGKKSMGAGGSVGRGPLTPHTKISLSMTQSMIYRKDGSAIENNGVTPEFLSEETHGAAFWDLVKRQVEAGI